MAVGLGPLPVLHPVPGFELGIASAGIKRPGRRDVVVMRSAERSIKLTMHVRELAAVKLTPFLFRNNSPFLSRLLKPALTPTSIGCSVWFWTTTGSSNRSPKLRNRGADGRTITGSFAVIVDSFAPNWRSFVAATAITR